MTLAEILQALFPDGHAVHQQQGLLFGEARLGATTRIHILGLVEGVPLGIEEAAVLAARVLRIAAQSGDAPLLLLLDSGSQRFAKRDEMLGLHEYLAHLAKSLMFADLSGHRTLALLYGHTGAGAFIATGLATGMLVALPGATPTVMDLPSMARITKLPLDLLQRKAQSTPVFAPGLENLARTGAVHAVWSSDQALAEQLAALLKTPAAQPDEDVRDRLGEERRGRSKAAAVAARVMELAARA